MVNVIAANHQWYYGLAETLSRLTKQEFKLVTKKDELTLEALQFLKPRYVFLPHWSYLIPADIYENFECVIFHMTDLPFGRGGSPLQNLISRGIYETKISALKCSKELDGGPIYIKEPLDLHGNAEEIYIRAAKIIEKMICYMIENEPIPIEQTGEVVCFDRKRPEDGNISSLEELQKVFDFIRMLDAEGYPRAFLETEYLKLEFEHAALEYDCVEAHVKITRKKDIHEQKGSGNCGSS